MNLTFLTAFTSPKFKNRNKKKNFINNIHFKSFDLSLWFKFISFKQSFSEFKGKQTSLYSS